MYNHPVSARRLALPLVVLVAAVLAGCQQREVEKVLKVTDVNTGWYDVGIVAGQNKIVPSVSFHLQNVSPEPIENVQINAVFRRLNEAGVVGRSPDPRRRRRTAWPRAPRARRSSCGTNVATRAASRARRC